MKINHHNHSISLCSSINKLNDYDDGFSWLFFITDLEISNISATRWQQISLIQPDITNPDYLVRANVSMNVWTYWMRRVAEIWHHISLYFSVFIYNISSTNPEHTLDPKISPHWASWYHYVIMGTIVSQITSLMTIYSTLYSNADKRKHQTSAALTFVREIPCTKGQ